MQVQDRVPVLRGHWAFDIFEGDPVRAPITAAQEADNEVFRRFCESEGQVYLPIHVGEILSTPIDHIEGENIVTTAGKGLLLDRLFAIPGTVPAALTHMGVGNSATAAAVGNTQLLGATPAPFLKVFDALPTRSGLVVSAVTTFATTDTGSDQNWQELGLFNGGVNGTAVLFNRIAPIGPFNKTSAVSIVVTVTITQS